MCKLIRSLWEIVCMAVGKDDSEDYECGREERGQWQG